MIARQFTCVAIDRRAVLIDGAPGVGKSTLALALIDRGAVLVGDDSVMLEKSGTHIRVSPHPQTRGMLEVRNLGVVTMPVAEGIPVCLVCTLREAAPRFIDSAGTLVIEGLDLPRIQLEPFAPLQAVRVELGLKTYGLTPRTA
ncbi:HPr kinase/phosphorylase [Novosphingobium aquimarinum]|uniref:HPr kinase/phosphorylase n=1 Tax=Novosphingobium aquimarinum TaxID=2682494 RepID=UPI0012EBB1E3|nr:serine kinase [Novosphingobium aquimarinum]